MPSWWDRCDRLLQGRWSRANRYEPRRNRYVTITQPLQSFASARAAIAAALVDAGRGPDTPVAVIQNGTTAAQRTVCTTLAGHPDVDLGPPAVIVVGPVAGLGWRARGPDGSGG